MGLFDKKTCDVCGNKIGLLGNRKLEDGNLCKDCAAKLSPWFSGRRHSTLSDIKSQLEDREANKSKVASFRKSKQFGFDSRSLYIDETQGNFAVCYESDWSKGNPDILPLSSITSCRSDITEHRTERKRKDKDGNMVSYNPPIYDYSYDYYIMIDVDHPYIDDMKFRVNSMTLKRGNGSLLSGDDRKISECESMCSQIVNYLQGGNNGYGQPMGYSQQPGFGQPMGYGVPNGMGQQVQMGAGISGMAYDGTPAIDTVVLPPTNVVYRSKSELGMFALNLNVTGQVILQISDPALYAGTKISVPAFIQVAARKALEQFEQQGFDIKTVTPELYNNMVKAMLGGTVLQQFGASVINTALIFSMNQNDSAMLDKIAAANASSAGAAPVSQDWECPACTATNHGGKFCAFCGSPRA